MATRVPALIQLSDPRVAAQLVLTYMDSYLTKFTWQGMCVDTQQDEKQSLSIDRTIHPHTCLACEEVFTLHVDLGSREMRRTRRKLNRVLFEVSYL